MTTALHAVQVGAGTPESDKARGANAGQVGEQARNERPNFALTDAEGKEFSRLRALLAMHGHCAFRTTDPDSGRIGYAVTRGGWLREVADLAGLHQIVERIGGAA